MASLPQAAATAAARQQQAEQHERQQQQQLPAAEPPEHILFDIMDVCVADPFYTHMAAFFGLQHEEFLRLKDPHAWIEWEKGLIDEEEFYARLFTDRRAVDGPGLCAHMERHYCFVAGMDDLLARLAAAGHSLHAFTNYTTWYRTIDAKLALSRWLRWSFVSAHTGLRKPAPEAFDHAARTLGCPPHRLLFIDDRQANVEAARAAGMQAIHFWGDAAALEAELRTAGMRF